MSSFEGIANKFDKNIYGTSKGKIRHALLLHHLDSFLRGSTLKVADVGGGTGIMGLAFAEAGHEVLSLDISDEVLSIATKRLALYPNAQVANQSLFDFKGTADLVLCHAVLEWLDRPFDAIEHLVAQLQPGNHLSLSFFNHNAMLFNNILYGNFDYVQKGMKVRNQVRLNPHNPQKPDQVLDFIAKLDNVDILQSAGIRCFHDYIKDKRHIEESYEDLLSLEKQYGSQSPYKFLGKYFHCVLRKR